MLFASCGVTRTGQLRLRKHSRLRPTGRAPLHQPFDPFHRLRGGRHGARARRVTPRKRATAARRLAAKATLPPTW
ncbi:MAG: hypothetical protein LBT94_03130 [Prevotellaceae bacterium]|nr:hypothetical protein [Prevotellaceae bacterium]